MMVVEYDEAKIDDSAVEGGAVFGEAGGVVASNFASNFSRLAVIRSGDVIKMGVSLGGVPLGTLSILPRHYR